MKQKWIRLTILLLLLTLQGALIPARLAAAPRLARATAAERAALIAAWVLPGMLYESGNQVIQGCVSAGFAASQQSRDLTGTLTYDASGAVTYAPTPHDRLRVVAADGTQIDFNLLAVQGDTSSDAQGFLTGTYQLTCRVRADGHGELTIEAEQTRDSLLTRTLRATMTGNMIWAGETYTVDAESSSEIYFESSFGGSEYREQTHLKGTITGAEFTLTLADAFAGQQVTFEDESASAYQRTTNGQWQLAGRRYAFVNGYLNRSFQDGQPARVEMEWIATGAIRRDNQRWGEMRSRGAGDFFEAWAVLPEEEVPLARLPLTAAAATMPPQAIAADQNHRVNRSIPEAGSVLRADKQEREALALDLYQQIGLSPQSAGEFVQVLGVEDEMMVILLIAAVRSYNLDHRYADALALARQTLADLADHDQPEPATALFSELGKTHYYLGNTESALDYLTRALAGYRAGGNAEQQAVVLANLGLVYESQSDYEAALAAYQEALDQQQRAQTQRSTDASSPIQRLLMTPLSLDRGTIYNNLGSLYHTLGENAEAVAAYEKALMIQREADDSTGEAVTQHNLGKLYTALGRHEQALATLQAALSIAQRRRNPLLEGYILSALGDLYAEQKTQAQALAHYERALARFQQINQRAGAAFVRNNMAVLHVARQAYDEAEQLFQQALDSYVALGDQANRATVISNLGFIQEQRGDLAGALDRYREAVTLIEAVQSNLQVEDVKSAFLANQSQLYAYLISRLWEQGEFQEAFAYAERARARAFLELLGNAQVDLSRATDDPLIAEAERQRSQLVSLQNAYAAEQAKALNERDQGRLDRLSAQREEARNAYAQLLTRIKLASPDYAAHVEVETVALEAVQQEVLDAETTLIEYVVLDEHTLAWVIDQDGFQVIELPIDQDDLTDQVEELYTLITEGQEFDVELANALYRSLFAPLAAHIRHTNLVIAPHGVLHYLPFAALWDAERDRYLIEEYAVTYVPSASVLNLILDNRNQDAGQLLALGNPDRSLPKAEAEVQAVAALYDSKPLVRSQATESRFRTQAVRADILHLAAHGVYHRHNPLFTRIELAPDAEHDGHLEVHEVFELQLPAANLVVLSACETALGRQSAGDELVGLTRAFLYAGTPAVVTTLWTIDDAAAAVLMQTFHQQRRAGLSTAEALRAAQVAILTQPAWATPYFWAAFTLTGDYR